MSLWYERWEKRLVRVLDARTVGVKCFVFASTPRPNFIWLTAICSTNSPPIFEYESLQCSLASPFCTISWDQQEWNGVRLLVVWQVRMIYMLLYIMCAAKLYIQCTTDSVTCGITDLQGLHRGSKVRSAAEWRGWGLPSVWGDWRHWPPAKCCNNKRTNKQTTN